MVPGALLLVDAAPALLSLDGSSELYGVGGPDAGQVHRLSPGAVVVGRGKRADVRPNDRDVSREHLRLSVLHDGVHVVDVGSANGTSVDGTPVAAEGAALATGAMLRAGRSSLVLRNPVRRRHRRGRPGTTMLLTRRQVPVEW